MTARHDSILQSPKCYFSQRRRLETSRPMGLIRARLSVSDGVDFAGAPGDDDDITAAILRFCDDAEGFIFLTRYAQFASHCSPVAHAASCRAFSMLMMS